MRVGTAYNADEAISPTSTERSFNMMDELSSPTLSLGLDNDSNEHFMSNKQALAARLGGGNSKQGNNLFPGNQNQGNQGQIFSNLALRGMAGQRFGDSSGSGPGGQGLNTGGGQVGFQIPGIAAITAAAEAVDDHKKESGFSNQGVTSPSILRPVRSSSFYNSSYKQQEPSSHVFQNDLEQVPAGGSRVKKQSHVFSTSSSGAFSSPLGLQGQKHAGSSYSVANGNDSVLKENATQATSVYFADKHQELNLPPKFVKQMLKLEKERNKLIEKERIRMSKEVKLSASKKSVSSSGSKSTGSVKSSGKKNKNQDDENDEERGSDEEVYMSQRDSSVLERTINWVPESSTDQSSSSYQEGGSNSLINIAQNDKKNNKKLGKLGKISKVARSNSVDEPITPNTGSGGQRPDPSNILTPGGSHMHMLMRAAGSISGMGSNTDPTPDGPGSVPREKVEKVERIPGKVGRPKLSLKDRVSGEILSQLLSSVSLLSFFHHHHSICYYIIFIVLLL